jgi:hypothetical protein
MSKSRFVAVSRAGRRKGQNEHLIANQLIKALARTGVRAFMYSGCARGNSPLPDYTLSVVRPDAPASAQYFGAANMGHMALIVFLRGIDVGGHGTFRPSVLAKELGIYDAVNGVPQAPL